MCSGAPDRSRVGGQPQGGGRGVVPPRGSLPCKQKKCGSEESRLHRGRARLAEIVEERAFVLHFQPIVGLQEGRTSHYEALLRLPDSGCGPLLPPEPFLRAAERYGLAPALDRAVIEVACERLGRSGATVAINLSALSLTDASLVDFVASALRRWAVGPKQVILEITETAAIPDLEQAAAVLGALRELGVRVAFDDFGVGCNSLQYLTTLPFDIVKIDGLFIRRLLASSSDRLVVEAVVALARGLGKQTVAEYVADSETVSLLRSLGVDHAQGFALGRPRATVAR